MKTITNCANCENSKFDLFIKSKDYSVSGELFQIVKCEKCDFFFTNPRPKDKSLDKYYLSENYMSHTNSKKGLFENLYQIVRKYSIKKKYKLISSIIKNGEILDIGCGTGEFLNKCKSKKWKTKGIEPSDIARKKAQENYNLDIKKSTDLSKINNQFDIITMWHVLEHVPNLNESINQFHQILKKNGKIIVAVPNLESYDCSYYKKYWAGYDLPIHLYHFSKKSIQNIFNKHRLKLIKTKGMKFDSYYVSLLSEEYKNGNKNYLKAFIIGSISNLYGYLTKRGFSSTIYVFEKEEN